jgi:hypothetical protein
MNYLSGKRFLTPKTGFGMTIFGLLFAILQQPEQAGNFSPEIARFSLVCHQAGQKHVGMTEYKAFAWSIICMFLHNN